MHRQSEIGAARIGAHSEDDMLRILGRANSINVRRVLWMCGEIGETFEREDWGRGYRPTSEPGFRKYSEFGVVPVIDDDGFILRESNAIVRYLANKHKREDLYPADIRRRAEVEAWMDWATVDLSAGVRPVFLGLVVKMPPYTDPNSIEAGRADWTRQMQRLDDALEKGGPYVMGQAFTIADIPVGLVVNRWFQVPFEKPDLPAVSAYYDRLAERPAFREHGRNGTP
jgi:glutathione S-transferase